MERVEARLLLANFIVTDTGDSASDTGSLRYALLNAVANDRILFAIPTSDPNYHAATGSWTIQVASTLTVFSPSIFVDGLSQQSQPGASTTHPAIEITPSASFSGSGSGLALDSHSGSGGRDTIRGLAIDGFQGAGIFVSSGAIDNLVTGNFIGTDVTGTISRPNAGDGILVYSSGNTIGGTASGARNVVSGNGVDGISLSDSGATNNLVQGNFIGTDASGTVPLGNARHGVSITQTNSTSNPSGSDNTIGGTATGAGNLISGNGAFGIVVFGPSGGASGNLVQGNLVGTDASGTRAIGNAGDGIVLSSAFDNTVGGTSTGARNVIAGNGKYGVVIESSSSSGNLVQGNFIGTDVTGTNPLGNANNGAIIQLGAFANAIGGTAPGAGNTIAFNAGSGVTVDTGTGNAILSNSIFDNAGGGIVLTNGGNNDQTAPALADAYSYANQIVVDGTLAVRAGTGYVVQFFGNNPPSGQGRILLGSQTISPQAADSTVTLSFTTSANLPFGSTVTAIASVASTPAESLNPAAGDTSAFSTAAILVNPFIVTNTKDFGIGSLRFAVQTANGDVANDDTITFQIPTSDPGYSGGVAGFWTISVLSGLMISKSPTAGGVQHTVFINGSSQPGANPGHPVIVVTPGGDFSGSVGLQISSSGNTVSSLVINGFPGDGIDIGSGASNNLVTGCFIGTDPLGIAAVSNGGAGVRVGSPTNTLTSNVISASGSEGIFVEGGGNIIQGNHIGTNAAGTAALGNGLSGITIQQSSGNIIRGNVISGNGVQPTSNPGLGIVLSGSQAQGNLIQGNLIGTDATGTNALPNFGGGVFISGPGNTVGGTAAGEGNVISGNKFYGIQDSTASSNQILGNLIGTDASGTAPLGNGGGVRLDSTSDTVTGNVISANGAEGIFVGARGNIIQGNHIGTNAAGTSALGNGFSGILLNQSSGNIIRGNVISGNGTGLAIAGSGAQGNLVQGNFIGTDAAGIKALPNLGDGVAISGPNNSIGGTAAGARNIISGNQNHGLSISGASGNTIAGNTIGAGSDGATALGNGLDGIFLNNAPGNAITGNLISGNGVGQNAASINNAAANAITRNLIAGNGVGQETAGISVTGSGSSGNVISDNRIGTNATGTAALGNSLHGIFIGDGASNNTVGPGNLISGNGTGSSGGNGLTIASGVQGILVQGNMIGTNAAGTGAIPNLGDGVNISGLSNTVGGTASGSLNVISGNRLNGITIEPGTSSGNQILGNRIGTDSAGTVALGNGASGISVQSSGGIIRGNVISGNGTGSSGGSGFTLSGSGAQGNLVQGNFIGTDAAGIKALPNLGDGVAISGPNNSIGGTAAGARNIISGNQNHGLSISGASGNTIAGNTIGAGSDGATALGNGLDGIFLNNAPGNAITGNLISGNGVGQDAAGINVTGSGSTGNVISDNRIGTNAMGTAALGNSLHGIFIGDGAGNNTVGPGNLISGNGLATNQGVGVYLFGATTTGNQVIGNRIGTDATGATGLTETVIGVLISQSPGNTIQGNLISGHRFVGVEIAGATASGNQVLGNLIGTDSGGNRAIPNGSDGVFINDSPNNTIGGTATGAGNLISGNGSVGIQLFGAQARGNVVEGNRIGLDSAGRPTLPNRAGGIFVNTGPQANQIGGTASGQANAGQKRPTFSLRGFHLAHRARRLQAKGHAGRQSARPHLGSRVHLRPRPH